MGFESQYLDWHQRANHNIMKRPGLDCSMCYILLQYIAT